MKTAFMVIAIVVVLGSLFGLSLFFLNNAVNDTALIQKCERITGKGFFECGQYKTSELEALK